jgi:hypothetical protein
MKYRTALVATVIPLSAGLALASAPGYADTGPTHHTTFAFGSSGYGTRVTGGKLPVSSDTTGYQVVGCTDRAGVHRTNDVADATVPGLGTVSGVRTRVWTTQRHGVTTSHSTHRIAQLTVASSGLGSLSIDAITSRSRAFHDARGFHAVTATAIGSITFRPALGPAQSFPAPTPDRPVEVPGLATISLGRHHAVHDSRNASADAFALRVDVIPTETSVKVAHTHAELHAGLTYGLFRGHSNASRVVHALTDVVHSGPNPLTVMPCQGTYGVVRRKALADLDVGGQLVARGLTSEERAVQTATGAKGYEKGAVARINLGHGQLVVNAIVGKVTVERTSHGLVRSTQGTRLGTITANGVPQTFPRTGVLEIPGLVKLERHVVTRTATGIKVVALRVTLLDGSGAVVDLGEAQLQIRPLSH